MTRYGDIPPDRVDIRGIPSLSVDLRRETGADRSISDETRVMPPGVFTLSVFGVVGSEVPIGEIRCMVKGIEVSIVGHLTGRPDVLEVTPDHIVAMLGDNEYRLSIISWLGISA
tara:strand:+ start:482 stop:823 length:342 start_codon:yes stop_codon:yes gene_type:complete